MAITIGEAVAIAIGDIVAITIGELVAVIPLRYLSTRLVAVRYLSLGF